MSMLDFAKHFLNPVSSKNTKGVSGSKTLQSSEGSKWYQVKYSSLNKKKLLEKAKARAKGKGLMVGSLDHENIGELIIGDAAIAMKSVFSGNTDIASPNIDFVSLDPSKPKSQKSGIIIASEFIPNFKDLAGVFRDKNELKNNEEVRYLKVNFNSNIHKITKRKKNKQGVIQCAVELGGADLSEKVRKGISDGVALNALFGNADVNAGGNMGVQVDEKGNPINAAILDFGHGFNNLIYGPTRFGGGVKGKNGILDFLNREKVLKAPSGGKSKLWRDYEGLVPSETFVESLEKISSTEAKDIMRGGINSAKAKLKELKEHYNDNHVDLGMMEDSLKRLCRNTGNSKIKYKNIDDLIDKTMENLEQFTSKRMDQAKEVAKTMKLQLAIDELAKDPEKTLEAAAAKYYELNGIKQNNLAGNLRAPNVKIQWVKTDSHNPAKNCTLEEYFKAKQAELNQEQSQEKKQGKFTKIGSSIKKAVGKWSSLVVKRSEKARSQDQGKGTNTTREVAK